MRSRTSLGAAGEPGASSCTRGNHGPVTSDARRHHVIVHHVGAMVTRGQITEGAVDSAPVVKNDVYLMCTSGCTCTFICMVKGGAQCISRVIGSGRWSGTIITLETCHISFIPWISMLLRSGSSSIADPRASNQTDGDQGSSGRHGRALATHLSNALCVGGNVHKRRLDTDNTVLTIRGLWNI